MPNKLRRDTQEEETGSFFYMGAINGGEDGRLGFLEDCPPIRLQRARRDRESKLSSSSITMRIRNALRETLRRHW